MLNNLLIYRFILTNAIFATGGAILWMRGVVAPIFLTDTSYISYGIVALFAVSWGWILREVIVAASSLNTFRKVRHPATEAERDKDLAKIEWLNAVSGWLVALGLLGTVVGFWMALNGVAQDSIRTAAGAQGAVVQLMKGMQVAIGTTLVGAVLGLLNEVNYRMLRTGLHSYWCDRVAVSRR